MSVFEKISFFIDKERVEPQAINQICKTAKLPWLYKMAVMPDVHLGVGCCVGSVLAMKGAVVPSAVGVDVGCVDAESEFLTPVGWKKISDYKKNDLVLDYNPENGISEFVEPVSFLVKAYKKLYSIKTKYGVNQVVSPDHRVLYKAYDKAYSFTKDVVDSAQNIVVKHTETKYGFRGRFITTFTPLVKTRLPLTDAEIRVMVMVMADGSFPKRNKTNWCSVRVKKQRKISRATELLKNACIDFKETNSDGVANFRFYAPVREKSMSFFWKANVQQLRVITEESFLWDGNLKDRCFFTRDKESADFMSYCFASSGFRSVLREDLKEGDTRTDYRVFAHKNTLVGINGSPKTQFEEVVPKDGYAYCFTLSTGFWVMRRGGVIAVTGNCGMGAYKTNIKASDLPDSLKGIRHSIERSIPVGFNGHKSQDQWKLIKEDDKDRILNGLSSLGTFFDKGTDKYMSQCGTLGGGNHFIELCLDTEQNVWVFLHSGSRNLGKVVAEHHIKLAKTLQHNRLLEDQDLAAFLSGTPEMNEYRKGVYFCQDYAFTNRKIMLNLVKKDLKHFFPSFSFVGEPILCHHNYVAEEVHFGEDVFVTRKGAVSAKLGELALIPGSMGTRSYVVRGLGNADSLCSAPHGAGRRMSRSAAKKQYTVEDVEKQTIGVECRKDSGIIDEIPSAYKDIEVVMQDASPLVEIVTELKAILCVKG